MVPQKFSPDDILIMHSTFSDEDVLVNYRGPLDSSHSVVVIVGGYQMSCPNEWLRKQEETK